MSNEIYYKKKYLSYKLKYLQTKLTQNGGGKIELILPDDIKKIKKINEGGISSKSSEFIIKHIETDARLECDIDKSLQRFLNKNIKDKKAHIWFETENQIYLIIDNIKYKKLKFTEKNGEDIDFDFSKLLENKCLMSILIEIEQENVIENKQQIDINYKEKIQNQQQKDVQQKDIQKEDINYIEKIQNQIDALKNEIEKLKNEFDNHYHDLPTTGIRQYTKEHPFLKKS